MAGAEGAWARHVQRNLDSPPLVQSPAINLHAEGPFHLPRPLRAFGRAVRRVSRAAAFMVGGNIVARRYIGTLGGSAGGEPLVLLYLGREDYAREFELYFREEAGRGIAPESTLFRGNILRCLLRLPRAREALPQADRRRRGASLPADTERLRLGDSFQLARDALPGRPRRHRARARPVPALQHPELAKKYNRRTPSSCTPKPCATSSSPAAWTATG